MPADPRVISSLQDKAHELRQAIVNYEERLKHTRKELSVVTAALTIFQRDGGRITDTRPTCVGSGYGRAAIEHVEKAVRRGEVAWNGEARQPTWRLVSLSKASNNC